MNEAEQKRLYAAVQEWFYSGHDDRVITEGLRLLAFDPENVRLHGFLLLSYAYTEQWEAATPHCAELLRLAPEDVYSLQGVASYYGMTQQWGGLQTVCERGLSLEPENAYFHYCLAKAYLGVSNLTKGRFHINEACRLKPDDPDYVHLRIAVENATDTSAMGAVKRVEALQEALKLDPENAGLHHSIGKVYLIRFQQPKVAEEYFRDAVRLAPNDRGFQQSLFTAVAERSLFFGVFRLSEKAWWFLVDYIRSLGRKPLRILWCLIFIKVVVAFLLWLLVISTLSLPVSKAYQFLLVSEFPVREQDEFRRLRLWLAFQKLPFWFRFSVFLTLILSFWASLFLYFQVPLKSGFQFLFYFWLVHWVILGIKRWGTRWWLGLQKKRAAKRQLKQEAKERRLLHKANARKKG